MHYNRAQKGVLHLPLHDECLNLEWFMDLHHAKHIIENWRHDYNTFRPHSSLNNLPPATWAQNQLGTLSLQVG
jgi:transposase InsO family protein